VTKIARLMAVAVGLFCLCCFDGAFAQSVDWPRFGQNTANTASNPSETSVSAKNAKLLGPSWTFTTGGDVTARAAVVNDVAISRIGPVVSKGQLIPQLNPEDFGWQFNFSANDIDRFYTELSSTNMVSERTGAK
jgi:hypothetical protein